MRPVLLRVELPDRPGELHSLTAVLTSLGVNILGVDVEHCDGVSVVDALTVAVPDALSDADLQQALEAAGDFRVTARSADHQDLRDPVVSALDLAGAMARADVLSREHAEQTLRLVSSADESWLLPAAPDLPGIVGRAARLRTPVIERTTDVRLGDQGEPVWLLAAPVESGTRCRMVALLARRSEAFTATQVARTRAALRIITALRLRNAPTDSAPSAGPVFAAQTWPVTTTLRDGTPVQLRCGAEIDRAAVLRMHARCSDDTLYQRFFTPKPVLRSASLDTLVPASGLRASSVVAFAGGEAVGLASFHRGSNATATADLGILVDDAYQGLGLGRFLIDRLATTARHVGISRLVAEVLASNRPMQALAQRDHAVVSLGSTQRLVIEVAAVGQEAARTA